MKATLNPAAQILESSSFEMELTQSILGPRRNYIIQPKRIQELKQHVRICFKKITSSHTKSILEINYLNPESNYLD